MTTSKITEDKESMKTDNVGGVDNNQAKNNSKVLLQVGQTSVTMNTDSDQQKHCSSSSATSAESVSSSMTPSTSWQSATSPNLSAIKEKLQKGKWENFIYRFLLFCCFLFYEQ